MSLELKTELVQERAILNDGTHALADAIFSVDLEGIVDLMDPNRSSFTIMELLGFKIDKFPVIDQFQNDLITTVMDGQSVIGNNTTWLGQRFITFDTSVPDASQPTTAATVEAQEQRWLASATKVGRDEWMIIRKNISDGTNPAGGTMAVVGNDFTKNWSFFTNEKGQGKFVAAPRLVVRYFTGAIAVPASSVALAPPNEAFQLRLRYRTKRINKNQMWQMLLQQTPGETLIRSGTAAFP